MANYKIVSTNEEVSWPAYVSTIILEGNKLEKAQAVLEKALITLQAYGGPCLNISYLKSAQRTAVFLYEIIAELVDSEGQFRECQAFILNEPWMKANSIAAATFEFADEAGVKLVIKRKKSLKYYKDNEMLYEEHNRMIEEAKEKCQSVSLKVPFITDV